MAAIGEDKDLQGLREAVIPLSGAPSDYDPLLSLIGEAKYVLLGEATHGTHEFYQARADITKRLVRERGFNVIAWEADWPDALRINRYIQGRGQDATALDALGDFKRFPSWMWRNADILDLVGWLRSFNEAQSRRPKAGVYGLDLYSLHSSIHAVIDYLAERDPELAEQARRRYSCFEEFGEDPQIYGMTTGLDRSHSCEDEVVQQLLELQRRTNDLLSRDGRIASDELFFAEQNALVARDAEQYYRAMYRGRPNTWNLRDQHMVQTLDGLMGHLQNQGEHPKAIVWAHNSHLGDARATSMNGRGEWNVGQLVRERHGQEAVLVGFSTFCGTVTAASDWGAPAERKRVRPGLRGSYEHLFHRVNAANFQLDLRSTRVARHIPREMLERAIGVLYLPETERSSHYFLAQLARQFDAIIHFEETRAVEPLERTSAWEKGEFPDTYPWAV
jgi:erythromycin esterase-like protein